MAKKIANAQSADAEPADASTTLVGIAASITDSVAGTPAADEGSAHAAGAAGTLGVPKIAVEMNSNPASSDASAGTQGVEGSSTSSAGDHAGSPAQNSEWPWEGRPIPTFLDGEGKVRKLTAADVRPVAVTRNVKIDGVGLDAGTTPLMPRDVYLELLELNAVEEI